VIKQASLESIFTAALDKSTRVERAAFLDEACAGQPEMRERVEALLRADNDAGSFLAHPVSGMEATIAATGNGDTVNSGSQDVSLSFLKPCDTPGRLGSLDQYEIIEVVGQGGMGTVLRAFDTKLSRVVAVKVMAPELSANPSAVKRFQREATTAAAVVHDHVVTIHQVETSHRPPYLVMQFVEGQTLQQKIDREGPLELKHILRIGSQMAAGLAAAHKTGLIHRDVKPGNILLENGVERVKITDFGLARAADDMEMTKAGMIAGTPQYMSPEQAKGEPIDSRSDLFSLGSVLYTMCTGRPAFRAETTMGVLRRVCEDAPRPIKEVNPEIPEWLCEIVDKLLEKQPERRFQTATEVADLLGQHLAHHQQPASCPLPARVGRQVDRQVDSADVAVRKEAKLFWATGILSLVASGLAIAGVIFGLPGFPRLLAIWFFAGGLLSLPVGVLILWAAHQVETRQSREWAMAAGLLSLLPINPFLMFCWPVTIWSLLTIRGAGAQGVFCAKGPQPAVPPKPSVRSTAEWRHKRSLAIATLIWLAIALPFCVATYYIRQAASRPEQKSIHIPGPGGVSAVPGSFAELAKRAQSVDGWIPLFSGADLAGWKPIPPQNWRVENGVIHGSGPDGFLFSDVGDFEDFHLVVEYRINAEGDSGILFRAPAPVRHAAGRWGYIVTGPEAQVSVRREAGYRSGALTVVDPDLRVLAASSAPPHAANEWARLELIALQDRIQILLNGKLVTDYLDRDRKFSRGHIALCSWEGNNIKTNVEFRKVEIRKLPGPHQQLTGGRLTSAATSTAISLADQYDSEFGVVTLTHEPIGVDQKQVTVTGSWDGRPVTFGKFTDGLYVPVERQLVLHYVDEAIHVRGTARLQVSDDGQVLRGLFVNEMTGQSGIWTLERRSNRTLVKPVDLRAWGKFVDPRGECQIKREPSRVVITAPGTRPYNLLPLEGHNLDAPRLLHEVEGDFILQVKVPPYERPTDKSSSRGKDRVSFRAAGLVLWVDAENLVRYERASIGEASAGYGGGAPYLHLEQYADGNRARDEMTMLPDDPAANTWLEIERRGMRLDLRHSPDGKTWQPWKPVIIKNLPPRVSIGIVAQNSTNTDFSPAFENLAVTLTSK